MPLTGPTDELWLLYDKCAPARELITAISKCDHARNRDRCLAVVNRPSKASPVCSVAFETDADTECAAREAHAHSTSDDQGTDGRTLRSSHSCTAAKDELAAAALEAEVELVTEPVYSRSSSTGYKGVYLGRKGRYQAQATHRSIGGFETAWEAGVAVAKMLKRRGLEEARAQGRAVELARKKSAAAVGNPQRCVTPGSTSSAAASI